MWRHKIEVKLDLWPSLELSGPHADGQPVRVFRDVWLEQRRMWKCWAAVLGKFSEAEWWRVLRGCW